MRTRARLYQQLFVPLTVAAAVAFTTQIDSAVSQPLPRRATTQHLVNGFFFQHFLFTGQPAPTPDQPKPRLASRLHAEAPYLFFDPRPITSVQPQESVAQPLPRQGPRQHQPFFFDPRPITSLQPQDSLGQPLARRALVLRQAFFFQEQPVAAVFTGQPFDALTQPLPRLVSRHGLTHGFFFDPKPIIVEQIQPQTQQPLPRYFVISDVPSFFFQEQPAAVLDHLDIRTNQPLARVVDRRHSNPSLFWQFFLFTDQPFDAVSQPLPRLTTRAHLPTWSVFDPYPIPVLTTQIENCLVVPVRLRQQPIPESFFTAPERAGEFIYLTDWFQPASEPARNFALRRLNHQSLVAAAPSSWFLPDLAATSFIPFGVVRYIAAPGMSVYFEATLKTSSGVYPAQARLYNITDLDVVSGSLISTLAMTQTRVRSGGLTLPVAAKEYRVEFGGQAGVGATYTIYTADLIFGG